MNPPTSPIRRPREEDEENGEVGPPPPKLCRQQAIAVRLPHEVLLVFDFDGVLCMPYTTPMQPFPFVCEMLHDLYRKRYKLALASFNPAAHAALRHWGILHLFHDLRHGSNVRWNTWKEYTKKRTRWREEMTKTQQINDMLDANLHWNISEIHFFDDDPGNIAEVQEHPTLQIHSHLIPTESGLSQEALDKVTTQGWDGHRRARSFSGDACSGEYAEDEENIL